MKILIVDDHPMVLHGLKAVLAAHQHDITGVETLEAASRQLAACEFDLVLLDFNLQQSCSFELLAMPGVRLPRYVVLLSGVTDQEDVVRGFELGVHAFIAKTVGPEGLLQALRKIEAIKPEECRRLVWMPTEECFYDYHDAFDRDSLLSGKEREVFMLLRRGLLDKQIADAMNLSVHTVRVHVRAIRRKREFSRRGDKAAD